MIAGFCKEEEKLFGPDHAYEAPAIVPAVNERLFPVHNGPLLAAIGAAGISLTVIEIVPATLVQPFTVAVTAYKPLPAVDTLLMTGFCKEEEKPFGPDQL